MKKFICLFFVLVAASSVLCGKAYGRVFSPATAYFKVMDSSAGLPDNSVNDIEEDEFGFIWVATWNGLARFDGTSFEIFRYSDTEQSLSNNMVRCLHNVEGGLWVGTDSGLDFFCYRDLSFTPACFRSESGAPVRFTQRISRIISNRGTIIILTNEGAMYRLDKDSDTSDKDHPYVFTRIVKPQTRRYGDVTVFADGKLMALSNEGVTVLSPNGENELVHNRFPMLFDTNMNIYCDKVRGRVIVGCGVASPARIYNIVSERGVLEPAPDTRDYGGLMSVAADGRNIYLATDGEGLYVQGDPGETAHYLPSNSSIPSDAIYTVFVDSHDNVWCGTYRHGLCLLSPELNSYTLDNVKSGAISYDIVSAILPVGNKFYLGLDGGGLDIYDPATNTSRNFNTSNSDMPGNNVTSLVDDGQHVWMSVYGCGLVSYDKRTGRFRSYRDTAGGNTANKLWVIADGGDGTLWVAGSTLSVFDKATGTFSDIEGCENVSVMSLVEDGDHMWVGTRVEGILKVDKRSRRVLERYSDSPTPGGVTLPGHQVDFLFMDSQRTLWFTQGSYNLCSLSLTSGRLHEYGAMEPNNRGHVFSMVEDAAGNMWIGSDDGLFRYDRAHDLFVRKYDSRMPLTFISNASAVKNDKAYFGTTGGLLSVPLDGFDERDSQETLLFTQVSILDNEGTIIPLYTSGASDVDLGSEQNFFTISFTVPEMSNPEQLHFECRLEGLEDVWRDATATRSVTYTNVPTGSYRLLVRHTSKNGRWNEPSAIGINVRPVWYASVWARFMWVVLGLAILGIIIRLSRQYLMNLEKRRIAEFERDSSQRLNEAKMDFYANITHELRTPCFLIAAQIEEILDSDRQTVPVQSLSGIYRNSAKLNKLINHIIDFRKNDTGHLRLENQRIELVAFLRDLTPDYEQLCHQKSLRFNFESDPQPIFASLDSNKLEQIVTNLISNAYKYTPKGGSVTLRLRDKGENVEISVADTGIGVIDKLHNVIFEPFVRTERGKSVSQGDGIGLAYVKELVELHGGTINLDSRVNEGSTFTVTLPKNSGAAESVAEPESRPRRRSAAMRKKTSSKRIASNPLAERTILIVDDDPEVQEVVGRAFADGYQVSVAPNGTVGFEMAKTGKFDVVVTDLMMGETDGHSLVRQLRSDKATKNMKIVILSAITSEKDMVQALDEGADAYLTKPTPLKVLRRQVDKLFENTDETRIFNGGMPIVSSREDQKFVLQCRRIIDECSREENFGIDMLAQRLALSHSTLYKRIRRITGMSVIEFINEYRINKAILLIQRGNYSVQRISEEAGFRDSKTFRDSFKRKTGLSPKQYVSRLEHGIDIDINDDTD